MGEYDAPLAATTLTGGYQIVFEAIDPTTGAPVAGVEISAIGIYDGNGVQAGGQGTTQVDEEAPVFVPIPLDDLNAA